MRKNETVGKCWFACPAHHSPHPQTWFSPHHTTGDDRRIGDEQFVFEL